MGKKRGCVRMPSNRRTALQMIGMGVTDLEIVSNELGMSKVALARWLEKGQNGQRVGEIERVCHRTADLLLADARAEAVRRLIELMRRAESEDVKRKACVDVLRLDRRFDEGVDEGGVSAVEDEEVRRALRELGGGEEG